MDSYTKKIEIRWSDLDPNFHLRHSVYYDFGAYCRICFLSDAGATPAVMMQQQIGPIIFREEAVFKKEIYFGDTVHINILLDKCNADYSRWTMKHEIYTNNNLLSAIITIDGAWMNTHLRKLAKPGELFAAALELIPKTSDFSITEKP